MTSHDCGRQRSLETPLPHHAATNVLRGAMQGQEQSPVGSRMHALPDLGLVSSGAVGNSASMPDVAFLQERLLVLSQVNERLSEELDQSQQHLKVCLEQLQGLRGEQTLLEDRVQALEVERTQLLAALGVARGQEACPVQVQGGPGHLGQELAEEEMLRPIHQEAAEFWKARWHQAVVALKLRERELKQLRRLGEAWLPSSCWAGPPPAAPSVLRPGLDRASQKPGDVQKGLWPQQLAELRSREEPGQWSGHAPLGSTGTAQRPQPQKAPLQEVGSELTQMRAALQKVWDTLKMETRQWAPEGDLSQVKCHHLHEIFRRLPQPAASHGNP